MTEEQLITDMKATFPGLYARPLREFGSNYRNSEGVWTGGDTGACMQDGLPIFSPFCDEGTHEDGIHTAFIAWLESRGWYVESYDPVTYLIVRLPSGEEIAALEAAKAIAQARRSSNLGKSPDGHWIPF